MRCMGMGEPQPTMEFLKGHPDPAGKILSYMGLERQEASTRRGGEQETSPGKNRRILAFPSKG